MKTHLLILIINQFLIVYSGFSQTNSPLKDVEEIDTFGYKGIRTCIKLGDIRLKNDPSNYKVYLERSYFSDSK